MMDTGSIRAVMQETLAAHDAEELEAKTKAQNGRGWIERNPVKGGAALLALTAVVTWMVTWVVTTYTRDSAVAVVDAKLKTYDETHSKAPHPPTKKALEESTKALGEVKTEVGKLTTKAARAEKVHTVQLLKQAYAEKLAEYNAGGRRGPRPSKPEKLEVLETELQVK